MMIKQQATEAGAAGPRVALVCPGTGRERRGYERITADMFLAFKDVVNVTLFKGGGPSGEREVVPGSLRRDGRFLRYLPLHKLIGRTPYHMECLTFATSLAPRLVKGHFDVVFTYDPPMLKLLWWIRRLTGSRFKILFAHGGAFPFPYWPYPDLVLHCSPVPYQQDLDVGVPAEKLALLPIGIWPERFEVTASRTELRRKYEISDSTLVLVSIAALNRSQKRIDHLIAEVARVDGDLLLWIDGSQSFDSDLSLIDLARERLGERCRITHVPSELVGELLAVADVMVVASLLEGFGLSIVEALCSGTPTLTHNSSHFQWLIGQPELMLDMSVPGALAARLETLLTEHGALQAYADKAHFRAKYSWQSLRQEYVDLFRRVALGAADNVVAEAIWNEKR